jgi:predicted transcriptional regulator
MKSNQFVKKIRKKLGCTQSELARMIWPTKPTSTGQVLISKYESGKVTPNGDTILKLLEMDPYDNK